MPETATDSPEQSSTSLSLVIGLREGSERSWDRLVDLYAPLVRSWCIYSGVSEARIADIVQEVFLAIHRAIDRFDLSATGSFRGWVWKITKNKIRDHFRGQVREPMGRGGSSALGQLTEFPDCELFDEEPSQPSDTSALVRRALEMVKVDFQPKTWDAFWRSAVLGQPTDVVAEALGLSSSSVRQAKSRVLRRLRMQLGDL